VPNSLGITDVANCCRERDHARRRGKHASKKYTPGHIKALLPWAAIRSMHKTGKESTAEFRRLQTVQTLVNGAALCA
jgi:hypothetical protein